MTVHDIEKGVHSDVPRSRRKQSMTTQNIFIVLLFLVYVRVSFSSTTFLFPFDIHINRLLSTYLYSRSFKPDFLLIRQPVRTMVAGENFKNLLIGLKYGGIPAINSLHSQYNFLDKPWVVSEEHGEVHNIQVQANALFHSGGFREWGAGKGPYHLRED